MASFLEAQGRTIVEKLGGNWTPQGGMCHCPAHDDRTPSLSVRIGDRALLFKCFAGCDINDVMRSIRTVDREAVRSMATGSGDGPPPSSWNRRRALEIWQASLPLAGTMAQAYLRGRAIRVMPASLRFNPRTPIGREGATAFGPALIAALYDRRRFVSVHRTFLDPRSACLAPHLVNPRRMLGRPMSGAVILAPATQVLGLAEGIETAISAMTLLGIPVWATLGNERLRQIAIPPSVSRLILLPDNDRGGRIGAARALESYASQIRTVGILFPPMGFNDWNDVHRMEGSEGRNWWRQAA